MANDNKIEKGIKIINEVKELLRLYEDLFKLYNSGYWFAIDNKDEDNFENALNRYKQSLKGVLAVVQDKNVSEKYKKAETLLNAAKEFISFADTRVPNIQLSFTYNDLKNAVVAFDKIQL